MLSKLFLLFGILSGVSQQVESQVVDCAAGKSVFTINSQDFSPNPPIVGENTTLWIDYTVPDGVTVDAGTAKYSVSLNGIPFSPTVDDLCTQVTCPQTSGTYNITSTSVWSGGVSGKIVTKIQWYDGAGNQLLCSQTTFRVSFPNVKKYLRSGLVYEHSAWSDTTDTCPAYDVDRYRAGSSVPSGSRPPRLSNSTALVPL